MEEDRNATTVDFFTKQNKLKQSKCLVHIYLAKKENVSE